MMEENTKKKRGIGRIIWPLLLACLLLAVWIGMWQRDSLMNWGSRAEVEMTAVPESVTVSNDTNDDSSDSAESDSAGSDSAESDSAESGDADTSPADVPADTDANSDTSTDVVAADVAAGADGGTASSDGVNSDDASADTATVEGASDSDETSAAAGSSDEASSQFGVALNSLLVVDAAAAESEDNGLRLYATASLDAPTREVYNPGDSFRLVEPSEDFDAYPVEIDGISWVRVRDENGLLGWANLSLLTAE